MNTQQPEIEPCPFCGLGNITVEWKCGHCCRQGTYSQKRLKELEKGVTKLLKYRNKLERLKDVVGEFECEIIDRVLRQVDLLSRRLRK